jgi:hypothetical protein
MEIETGFRGLNTALYGAPQDLRGVWPVVLGVLGETARDVLETGVRTGSAVSIVCSFII